MKRIICIILMLCVILTLFACATSDKAVFTATVLENNTSLLVEPQKDTNEYKSSDKIVVHANDAVIYNSANKKINISDITTSQIVRITYNGTIAESYPAQIWATKIQVVE